MCILPPLPSVLDFHRDHSTSRLEHEQEDLIKMNSVLALSLLLVTAGYVRCQRLETPSFLIDPVTLVDARANGSCPAPPAAMEMYTITGDPTVRVCNLTSNPPTNVLQGDSGDEFWKSGNNIDNTSVTVTMIQVPCLLVLRNTCSQVTH